MRKIITINTNEEYLRKVSKKLNFPSKRLAGYIRDIKEYCSKNQVFAMVGIQLGIDRRIIYVKSTDPDKVDDQAWNEDILLINPVITSRCGLTKYYEACASCLDNMGLVERPYKITISYQDESGKQKEKTFEGFEATVLSHELDHLDGILHMDIAKELLVMTKEERKEFRKNHPYEIISKTCDYN